MIKRIAPIALIFAAACGGGGDSSGPKGPPSDISSMAVGDVRVLNPADISNGIDLPASSGNRDYVIVVGNTNSAQDVAANYVVKADRSPTSVFGIETAADMAASRYNLQMSQAPLARSAQQVIDQKVRSYERSALTLQRRGGLLGGSRLSARLDGVVAAASVPAVGDRINVKVPDANSDNLCQNFFQTQAVVASVSRRAILAVDTLDGAPAALFPQEVLDSITNEFDNVTYPTDSSYFGNPTDVDGNGHIILLFTGEVNKLTPPGTDGGFVGGFFFAGDFFPPTNQGGPQGSFCAQSNQEEIFYLLSPDPTGAKFGNMRTASSVRQGTRGTIAHEFQHMINAGNRFQNPAVSSFEETWLDEALAHFAEDAVGRVQRGFGDLQALTFGDLLPCNTPCPQANDFNAFFFQNLARLTYWMDSTGRYSPMSKQADTSLATRGAAWAIVRYAADNFSSGDPRKFTRTLAAGPDIGVTNFTAAAKTPVDTLVKGWLVSMYADHLAIANLPAEYQYRSYNFHSVMPPVAKSVLSLPTATYPLAIKSIGSGSDNISASNLSGTGTYYRLSVAAGAGAKNVKILDTSGNNATFPGEHVYVLRVQ